jgi:hypothetical protein
MLGTVPVLTEQAVRRLTVRRRIVRRIRDRTPGAQRHVQQQVREAEVSQHVPRRDQTLKMDDLSEREGRPAADDLSEGGHGPRLGFPAMVAMGADKLNDFLTAVAYMAVVARVGPEPLTVTSNL